MILSESRSLARKTSLLWKNRIELDNVLKKNEEIVKSARRTLLETRKLITLASRRVASPPRTENDGCTNDQGRNLSSVLSSRSNHMSSTLIKDPGNRLSSTCCRAVEKVTHSQNNNGRESNGLYSPYSETSDDSVEIRIGNVFSKEEREPRSSFHPMTKAEESHYDDDMSQPIARDTASRHSRSKLFFNPMHEESYRTSRHDRDFVYEIKANISVQPRYSYYSSDRDAQQRFEQEISDRNNVRSQKEKFESFVSYPSYLSVPVAASPSVYPFRTSTNIKDRNASFREKDTSTSPQQVLMKNKKPGYLCNQCGKVYCRKYVLKIHQRVHSGEKPLQCRVCGKCFSDPSNMKKHVKLHDAEQVTYPCKFCGRHFIRKRGLLNHIQSIHSKNLTGDFLKEYGDELANSEAE